MGTRYFRGSGSFQRVGSTRYLTIITTNLTTITMSTGFTGMRLYNNGSNSLIWGDASISTNSGNFLYPGMAKDFGEVGDNFFFSMVADSANSLVAITEYK